ncbi:group II intron reverse transcriptase/maturase [Alkalimonas sp. MEB108]|uniref:RNA-directed DNA polymerase n=1 Tax=Alkalimonas cellulosilytica TaxID=3058395 RepID=A0ABU7JA53_9GAMM|nr:group II intron reverse transcriptase/maturase [Alkalimonas sp. MEB108]MEE2003428.1 group II intron reverse transcriptase/maturase [Alkalimonas sp. MEB108]
MLQAYHRVCRNKGAPGVDGVTTGELKGYLHQHWQHIKQQLLDGSYQPQPVRKVEIPKPGGGMRMLGIPCVIDRLIQQAMHQILSEQFEPIFSPNSYGFRPGKSAAQAVHQAREHMGSGKRWVVDIDMEKFFDRVNHDILMSRIARVIEDKTVLKLVRRYLQAGIMEHGITTARTEGTPQGGPLSPLLSNILLHELDMELERRGLNFCRYADDCNIYVGSERAAHRVLASMTRFLEQRLKLKVNREKSAADRPWKRSFLGYTVCSRKYNIRLKIADKSVKRFKGNIKALLRMAKGWSIRKTVSELAPRLRGWINYFHHADAKGIFNELDGWLRRHLRKILWRQWKQGITRARMLMRLGIAKDRARLSTTNGRGPWWNSGASHMNQALPKKLFDRLGLISLMDRYHQAQT